MSDDLTTLLGRLKVAAVLFDSETLATTGALIEQLKRERDEAREAAAAFRDARGGAGGIEGARQLDPLPWEASSDE